MGRWNPDRWCPRLQPFGIRSVCPRPHEILLRIPPEFLPDIIRAVMPHWNDEGEDSSGYPEVYGIPGLRERYERGQGVLHRPGFPGRIAIAATPGLWRKAVRVAADLTGDGVPVRVPWTGLPDDWHPCEADYAGVGQGELSPTGRLQCTSGFTSRILRRLPGLCPLPRADWHDLWVNHWHGTPDIQFEWLNGPVHAVALDRVLDPEFGPGGELTPFDGQSEEDCFSDMAGRVRVRATGQDGGQIVLRRLVDQGDDNYEAADGFVSRRHEEREAAERAHGYRPHGGRLARYR